VELQSEGAAPPDPETGAGAPVVLTAGRLLARNTLWSLLGQASPLIVAIFAIPPLLRGLGNERFGLLSLSWVLIGYFSLFDLGLGRALTQLVAERLGRGRDRDLTTAVWTSLLLMLVLSLLGGLSLALASPYVIHRLLHVPQGLEPETRRAFGFVAAAVPLVVLTAGLAGILSAQQRFGALNALRIPMSIFSFLGPLMVLPFTHSVAAAVEIQLAGRIVGLIAHAIVCLRVMPELARAPAFDRESVRALLRLGGWMTVTNIVGPLMVSLDRFLIGSWLSLSAVAYYVTPYEAATKLWIIPAPVVTVLFPAFATSFAQDRERLRLLFFRGTKYVLLALFPLVLTILVLAREGLTFWLGAEYAARSAVVLQLLAVGVFANSLAQVPYALIQGVGQPRRTAILHLIELPLYLLTLKWLIGRVGIEGAALAWLARSVLDAVALFAMTTPLLADAPGLLRRVLLPSAAALLVFGLAAASQPLGLDVRLWLLVGTLSAFAALAWSHLLAPERRALGGAPLAPGPHKLSPPR
jgi:O-antigen/teichoic acid export membrane protein